MRHGYSIQEGDKEKLLPSNSTRTVPAGEWSHSQSGTSFAYFLVVVATNILRYSGIQQGALALTSNALWPAPLPLERSLRWDRRVLPLGLGRRRRARSLPKPRACGTVPTRRCCTLDVSARTACRASKEPLCGPGRRVARSRWRAVGEARCSLESSGRSPLLS